jgi:hypothetical protein
MTVSRRVDGTVATLGQFEADELPLPDHTIALTRLLRDLAQETDFTPLRGLRTALLITPAIKPHPASARELRVAASVAGAEVQLVSTGNPSDNHYLRRVTTVLNANRL